MSLKKELKEDIWKIVTENEEPKKERNFFLFFVLRFLLGNDSFSLNEVIEVSKEVEEEYNGILEEVKEEVLNGDLIKAVENAQKMIDDRIKPVVRKIACK